MNFKREMYAADNVAAALLGNYPVAIFALEHRFIGDLCGRI